MPLTFGQYADIAGGLSTLLESGSYLLEGVKTSKAYKAAAKNAKLSGEFEAKQYIQGAGQARAEAQRKAIQERKAGRLAQSRAVAVAAASGGGASTSTVENIISNLAAEGEYNALSALYAGEEEARGMETAAEAARLQGKISKQAYKQSGSAAKTTGYQKAVGSLLSGYSSFLSKYGDEEDTSLSSTNKYSYHKGTD